MSWAAKKAAHFEKESGHRRTQADLREITDAAYTIGGSYNDSEDVFRHWVFAPMASEHVWRYIRAGITQEEALSFWEDRFAEDEAETAAALDVMAGLVAR